MNKLTILVGPPGSGKSTFAKTMEANGYLRISQDDQGKDGHMELFESHVVTGRDIVIDRMNFDKKQRDRYRLEAIKNGYTVNFVEFVTPRQVCFDRCMKREDHPTIHGIYIMEGEGTGVAEDNDRKVQVTNSALNTFFKLYEEVTAEEGELLRIQYNNGDNERTSIMVDLDGTLANLDHRLHYVKGEGKKNWHKFFKECIYDLVYEDVKGILEMEFEAGTDVVLCSGRPEDYRKETEEWLAMNKIPYTTLKMRPAGNYKSDDITKAMLYRYEIKPFYRVKYVLDDRTQVVNKWREIGLNCMQVRPGDF